MVAFAPATVVMMGTCRHTRYQHETVIDAFDVMMKLPVEGSERCLQPHSLQDVMQQTALVGWAFLRACFVRSQPGWLVSTCMHICLLT